MTHTKGPWHTGQSKLSLIIYDKEGWAIADAKTFHGKRNAGETHANAKLIAAAPELLDALEYLYRESNLNGLLDVEPSMKRAREAIAKAKGGE